jgi:cytoskeletal protein RodZ
VGALLFFGAAYLVRLFRLLLGLAALFAVGVWVWLALKA